MNNSPTIGIDLGNSFSCVAICRHGQIEIIPNDQGSRTTPSCVAFKEIKRNLDGKSVIEIENIVGDKAISQRDFNPQSGIDNVKRIIGHDFNGCILQEEIETFQLHVINFRGKPKYSIKLGEKINFYCIEQVLALILLKLKKIAELHLGCRIRAAVITVPSFFTDAQRKITIDAAYIAGLTVKRLLNDTTAAAIAYSFDKRLKSERNVLIYDLGSASLSVSIMSVDNENFIVKSVGGHTNLGGDNFDNEMVKYFVKEIREKHKDVELDSRRLRKLKNACEKAKRILSSSTTANIELSPLNTTTDFYSTISRSTFEELNNHFFHSTIEIVKQVLLDAEMEQSNIAEILLIGGSSRIPKIQKLLEDFFKNATLVKTMNADESAAYGAAVLAANLDEESTKLKISDIIPMSLRLYYNGTDCTIQHRNTKFPYENGCILDPSMSSKSSFQASSKSFELYQGEYFNKRRNRYLGTYDFSEGNYNGPVNIAFQTNINGILQVSKNYNLHVSRNCRQLKNVVLNPVINFSLEKLEEIAREVEKQQFEENNRIKAFEKKNDLEVYCLNKMSQIRNHELQLDEEEEQTILNEFNNIMKIIKLPELLDDDFYNRKKLILESILKDLLLRKSIKNQNEHDQIRPITDDEENQFEQSNTDVSLSPCAEVSIDNDDEDEDVENDFNAITATKELINRCHEMKYKVNKLLCSWKQKQEILNEYNSIIENLKINHIKEKDYKSMGDLIASLITIDNSTHSASTSNSYARTKCKLC